MVGVVNAKEYAAVNPENAPVLAVSTVKELEFTTVIIPQKLSAFAFLTIIASPLANPCPVWVIVKTVVALVHESPVLTVELETNQHSISAFK